MTLLHMRKFTTGLVAAPATGGLSIPIFLVGKGLFVSGLATITPTSIMLQRTDCTSLFSLTCSGHTEQLKYLTALVQSLTQLFDTLQRKEETLHRAAHHGQYALVNLQPAEHFMSDAMEMKQSVFEMTSLFLDGFADDLNILNLESLKFLESPSAFQACSLEETSDVEHDAGLASS